MTSDIGANTPPLDTPQAGGMETSDTKDVLRNDSRETPSNPKMSGAPLAGADDTRGPLANRNTEGPRQAGTTPRPTEGPIE